MQTYTHTHTAGVVGAYLRNNVRSIHGVCVCVYACVCVCMLVCVCVCVYVQAASFLSSVPPPLSQLLLGGREGGGGGREGALAEGRGITPATLSALLASLPLLLGLRT